MAAKLARVALSVALALGALAPLGAAQAADLGAGSHARTASACADASVLNRIVSRFRHQVTHVPHLPDVHITDFHRIHEHRSKPSSERWPIARRYCGATVELSDGGRRDIWYLIEDGMGFASLGNNVEFCVSGFDRWFVYNGRCRVLR